MQIAYEMKRITNIYFVYEIYTFYGKMNNVEAD